MANSFGIFNCKFNSNKKEFKTKVQFTLGEILRDAQFRFRQLKDDYFKSFELWEVEQERKVEELIIVAITEKGKTEYKKVSEYIIPETFEAYYSQKHNILLVKAPMIKRRYFQKLVKEHFRNDIQISELFISLEGLIKYIERIEKANIKRQVSTVEKVMLTGADVENDNLFDQLLEEGGELKSIKISFNYNDTIYKLQVSENGGIFLIGKYESINDQLEIINGFYENYLIKNGLVR